MKLSELMYGDLVRIRDDYPDRKKCGRIGEVKGFLGFVSIKLANDNYFSIHPDYLEPIPITAEVLKVNGWGNRTQRNDEEGEMEKWQFTGIGWVYHFSDGDWEFEIIGYGENHHGNGNFRGVKNYVHELQHVLKDVGLTDITMKVYN